MMNIRRLTKLCDFDPIGCGNLFGYVEFREIFIFQCTVSVFLCKGLCFCLIILVQGTCFLRSKHGVLGTSVS